MQLQIFTTININFFVTFSTNRVKLENKETTRVAHANEPTIPKNEML